jgi:hypothetical protein
MASEAAGSVRCGVPEGQMKLLHPDASCVRSVGRRRFTRYVVAEGLTVTDDSRAVPPDTESPSSVGARTLTGITLFWIPLALLTDGLTVLVLPAQLDQVGQARPGTLGAITFVALLAATVTQLIAGAASDHLRGRFGRGDVMTVGVATLLVALLWLGEATTIATIAAAFVVVQIAVAIAQAAQQGYLPDQIPTPRRGFASGLKGLARRRRCCDLIRGAGLPDRRPGAGGGDRGHRGRRGRRAHRYTRTRAGTARRPRRRRPDPRSSGHRASEPSP